MSELTDERLDEIVALARVYSVEPDDIIHYVHNVRKAVRDLLDEVERLRAQLRQEREQRKLADAVEVAILEGEHEVE
jgi:DNA repair ATPase RecN